jgi:16S rRNA (cytidine1402-2'-O)-methyltransferase
LVVVGTPIGNLGDLAPRAVAALASADVVVCEDTRRTRRLLTHAGVPAGGRLRSLPAPAEEGRTPAIVAEVLAGATVALVTDAGMPAISDPGARVVRAVLDAGAPVEVVPGPTALVTALVVSGLPSDRFVFEGFLPRKGRPRTERLAAVGREERTVVLYESPRRVAATLAALVDVCGPDRPAALVRELTKLHEEVRRASLGELAAAVADEEIKGECVVVLGPVDRAVEDDPERLDAELTRLLAGGASTRDAADEASRSLGVARRAAYARAIELSRR